MSACSFLESGAENKSPGDLLQLGLFLFDCKTTWKMEALNYRLTLRAFECHLDNGSVFRVSLR